MSKHQIALFTFTLGKGESIGPVPLRELWMRASGTNQASVGRKLLDGNADRPVYTLYGPQSIGDLRGVELRLRSLLEAAHLRASLSVLHV